YDIRKERMKWLISLLATHEMTEISEQFYELVSYQSPILQEPENHPYDIDWSKYDQLQRADVVLGRSTMSDLKVMCKSLRLAHKPEIYEDKIFRSNILNSFWKHCCPRNCSCVKQPK